MPQAPPSSMVSTASRIRLRRLGIDTYQEPVLYMHRDCHVCHSEGFEAQSRVEVTLGGRHIVATLNVVSGAFLSPDEAGLSEAAWRLLGARDGDVATLRHPAPLESLGHVRAKVYGRRLTPAAFEAVIADVVAGHYSDLQLAAFVTACAGDGLDLEETVSLTRAMVGVGERMSWSEGLVMDKHSVGGLPGNRTTMLIVPIVAACGLRMPKTSSRAITSPAGTADTMETLAPVDLDVAQIQRVVERTGGCVVWGGAVRLSPADDILIRVERPLDLDSQGQLVASVLSKKAAAGATHVLIDMPVGPTAKVRSAHAADALARQLEQVGQALGLQVRVVQTDGLAPVGRGIGPALEARDVLAVLQPRADGAGRSGPARAATGRQAAGVRRRGAARGRPAPRHRDTGRRPGLAQVRGDLRRPRAACACRRWPASASRWSRNAAARWWPSTTGAWRASPSWPARRRAPCAGIDLHVQIGEFVERGQPLFTLHANSPGALAYAAEYAASQPDTVHVIEDA